MNRRHGQVAILLSTYDGQAFLSEQLESIAAQTWPDWAVWASDDGSRDGTLELLAQYRAAWGPSRLVVHHGPREGFAANFLSLTCDPRIRSPFYAYCDQDDIWEPGKLRRALAFLRCVPAGQPALYCSRTRLVDAAGRCIGLSPLFARPPSFRNALVQSIGGGNTMVYNQAARELLRRACVGADVVTHDWWAYMVVTGCGGRVHYDAWPSVRYRQHGRNLVGMNCTWRARIERLRLLWQGRFRDWNSRNLRALDAVRPWLTDDHRKVLDAFVQARGSGLLPRVRGLARAGLYRQTLAGNLGLAAAGLLNRV